MENKVDDLFQVFLNAKDVEESAISEDFSSVRGSLSKPSATTISHMSVRWFF